MSVVNGVISRRHVPFRRAGRPRHHFLPAEETFRHISTQVVFPKGRPTIQVRVNNAVLTAFVDTGSEVTILKASVASNMPDTKILHSSKTLQGVAGAPMSVLGEMDVGFTIGKSKLLHRVCVADKINFPGDLLMGMDFLRRLDMRLVTSNKFSGAYLLLGGVHFSVKYTGEESLDCVLKKEEQHRPSA